MYTSVEYTSVEYKPAEPDLYGLIEKYIFQPYALTEPEIYGLIEKYILQPYALKEVFDLHTLRQELMTLAFMRPSDQVTLITELITKIVADIQILFGEPKYQALFEFFKEKITTYFITKYFITQKHQTLFPVHNSRGGSNSFYHDITRNWDKLFFNGKPLSKTDREFFQTLCERKITAQDEKEISARMSVYFNANQTLLQVFKKNFNQQAWLNVFKKFSDYLMGQGVLYSSNTLSYRIVCLPPNQPYQLSIQIETQLTDSMEAARHYSTSSDSDNSSVETDINTIDTKYGVRLSTTLYIELSPLILRRFFIQAKTTIREIKILSNNSDNASKLQGMMNQYLLQKRRTAYSPVSPIRGLPGGSM